MAQISFGDRNSYARACLHVGPSLESEDSLNVIEPVCIYTAALFKQFPLYVKNILIFLFGTINGLGATTVS